MSKDAEQNGQDEIMPRLKRALVQPCLETNTRQSDQEEKGQDEEPRRHMDKFKKRQRKGIDRHVDITNG